MFHVYQVTEADGLGERKNIVGFFKMQSDAEELAKDCYNGEVTATTVYDSLSEHPRGKNLSIRENIKSKLSKTDLTSEELEFLGLNEEN